MYIFSNKNVKEIFKQLRNYKIHLLTTLSKDNLADSIGISQLFNKTCF